MASADPAGPAAAFARGGPAPPVVPDAFALGRAGGALTRMREGRRVMVACFAALSSTVARENKSEPGSPFHRDTPGSRTLLRSSLDNRKLVK